jgi:hypothetical protein
VHECNVQERGWRPPTVQPATRGNRAVAYERLRTDPVPNTVAFGVNTSGSRRVAKTGIRLPLTELPDSLMAAEKAVGSASAD